MQGVDPDNPRFIQEYTKAKKYKDALQGYVQQSVNFNKEFTEAVKEYHGDLNDKFDQPGTEANFEKAKNGNFDDRLALAGKLLAPKVHDYEAEFIDKQFKADGSLGKQSETKGVITEPQKYDKDRLKELQGLKDGGSPLKADEQKELESLQQIKEQNEKLAAGYDIKTTDKNYGQDIKFETVDAQGNKVTMFKIPERELAVGRAMLNDPKAGQKTLKEMNNLREGKDASGNMSYTKDANGQDVPDPIFVANNQHLFNTVNDIAAGYSLNGQPMTGNELWAAQKLTTHGDLRQHLVEATPSENLKRSLAFSYSKAGQEVSENSAFAKSVVNDVYGWLTGDPTKVSIASTGKLQASLVGPNSYFGNEYKKGVGNNVSEAEVIKGEDGQYLVRVKTPASIARQQASPEVAKQYDALNEQMKALKNDPKVYDKDSGKWVGLGSTDATKATLAAKNKSNYEALKKQTEELDKQGGSGYETFTLAEGKKMAMQRAQGMLKDHSNTATELGLVSKEWDLKIAQMKGKKTPSDQTYTSKDKTSLQAQLKTNEEKLGGMAKGTPEYKALEEANKNIQKDIDNVDKAQGKKAEVKSEAKPAKATTKTVTESSLKAKVGTAGFEGYTLEELKEYYKGQGYTIK